MDNIENINDAETVLLRDAVYKTLRDAIFTGKLLPEDKLVPKELAKKINAGRTTITEALKMLEIYGLVEITRKGTFVTKTNETLIHNLHEVVSVLEALAVQLSCENISEQLISELDVAKSEFAEAIIGDDVKQMVENDQKFHTIIYQSTNNNILMQTINNLGEQINRCRYSYLVKKNYRNIILREHDELVIAMINQKKEQAQNIIKRHIINQAKAIIPEYYNL